MGKVVLCCWSGREPESPTPKKFWVFHCFTISGWLVSAPTLLVDALVSSKDKVSELDGRSCPVLLKWKGTQITHSHEILSLPFFTISGCLVSAPSLFAQCASLLKIKSIRIGWEKLSCVAEVEGNPNHPLPWNSESSIFHNIRLPGLRPQLISRCPGFLKIKDESEWDGRSCPVFLKWKGTQITHSHEILSLLFFTISGCLVSAPSLLDDTPASSK